MRIDILTLFPEFFSSILNNSITGRAIEKGILEYNFINIRDYADDKHNRVDDYPFGGGLGMLLKPQPIFNAYNSILRSTSKRPKTVYMSPRGRVFNQQIANELASEEHIVIICGHYEGVDQRIIDEICDYELSIGDFVLTGGEIPAIAVCDAVSRLVPGVLSEEDSYETESHYNGLLEFSQYTRPRVFNGKEIPEILLSGNQSEIDKWKYENSVEITKINRPDLYEKHFSEQIVTQEELKVSLLLLGNTQKCNFKVLPELEMQLKKRNVKIDNLFVNELTTAMQDNLVVLICGEHEFDFNLIKNRKQNIIFAVRETDTIALTDEIVNIATVPSDFLFDLSFKSISEISEQIELFLKAVQLKNKILSGESLVNLFSGLQKIKLLKPVPYDAFENNLQKFKKYTINDLYIFDSDTKLDNEFDSLIIDGNAYNVEIFKLKTKTLGTKYCLAVSDFEKLYTKSVQKDCYICRENIVDVYNCANKLL